MAIKTTGSGSNLRIITKTVSGQQRVSCSCCGGEVPCCMYPALGVTDGLITIEDLPDTVIARGLIVGDKTFTKLDPPEEYGTYTAYYITGSEPVGADGDFIGIDSAGELDNWKNYVGGGINGIGFCLIESFDNITGVNDTFEDTYTVEFDFSAEDRTINETVAVSRVDICKWTGTDRCGNLVELVYNSIDNSVEGAPARLAKWSLFFSTNSVVAGGECAGPNTFFIDKTGSANSPEGGYGDYGAGEGATVT